MKRIDEYFKPRLARGVWIACALAFASTSAADGLELGDAAPGFALQGSDGRLHALSDYRGQAVVLAWFPKAFTGG
jgi:hypothetical protein